MSDRVNESDERSRRLRERFALALPVRVRCRESADYEWHEMSHLKDVTPFGTRLRLKRPTEQGRLLLLTLAMPRRLRCFDHVEDQYRVWSLGRNVKMLDPQRERGALVEWGVAFVGKHPPRTYASHPERRYEIAPAKSASMWRVHEESDEVLSEVDTTEKRKETRHNIPIEVTIEVLAENGGFSESEHGHGKHQRHRGTLFHYPDPRGGPLCQNRQPTIRGRNRGCGADSSSPARRHCSFAFAVCRWGMATLIPSIDEDDTTRESSFSARAFAGRN